MAMAVSQQVSRCMQGFSRMLGFSPQAEEWQALLPPQQERAARLGEKLRALRIANTKLGSVPQAITQLPNLNHLSLTRCSLFVSPVCAPSTCLRL